MVARYPSAVQSEHREEQVKRVARRTAGSRFRNGEAGDWMAMKRLSCRVCGLGGVC